VLRALTVELAVFIFATFGLTDVLIYHLKHDLGQPDAVVGVVLGVAAVGTVGVAGICSMSLRQQITPDRLLGRVTAAFWTTHFAPGPAGAAVLTWAAARAGVPAACLASGSACLLPGVTALGTPILRAA
jgi:hypothetical protein